MEYEICVRRLISSLCKDFIIRAARFNGSGYLQQLVGQVFSKPSKSRHESMRWMDLKIFTC